MGVEPGRVQRQFQLRESTTTFLNLLSAQQQLLMQREQYQLALAGLHSRLAELERAVGGPLPELAAPEPFPPPPPTGPSVYRSAVPARPVQAAGAPGATRH